MLKFGNKEFRNLQEQVLENMKDIANLQEGTAVLSEFGIKVVGEVESINDLPTVLEYKSDNPDWAYGDAYAVGTISPYTLYILTRENDTHESDYWFDIGVFPAPGPQGEQGPKGDQGIQGPTGQSGADGLDAGFGSITATAETLSSGSAATASVAVSGPNTAKELAFTFGIPQNTPAGFTHYITITASTIVGTQATGTITLAQYNTLYDNYDAIVRLRSSSSLANNYYFLKKWYTSDDYIVFLGIWSLNNNDTRYYLLKIDRSTRAWTLDVGQPIKITSYNINSTTATAGQVLAADGNGGATWATVSGSSEVVTLTTLTGNLSDADYLKVAGNNCVIIYDDNTTQVSFRKYDETSTTITYAMPLSESSSTYIYGVAITKATKYYEIVSAYMPISNSNIKSGSTIADKYLKTNGSGGAVWGDAPSQVQSDWNESSSSSPAYIKNKPTIPIVPVTDVTVNGTSVLDGTTAKVLVSTVDGATDGTNWTSLTINGTTAAIPAAQIQSDYSQSDNTAVDYIKNKPDLSIYAQSANLATVATSGDYDDLLNKPTIPAAQVNSDWSAVSGVAQILNKPNLATVATSGSYNDLSDKPTLGTAAAKDFTSSVTSGSADLVTSGAVYTAIDNLPEPMVFKGSVGVGGTVEWANLPTASSLNIGFTYKVITANATAPICKVGDTIISDGTTWVVIPSGDEPSGTVTSVGVSVPTGLTVNDSPVTSSGTIAIGLDTGYVIPTQASLDNYVTTNTIQTITAAKIFNNTISISPLGYSVGFIGGNAQSLIIQAGQPNKKLGLSATAGIQLRNTSDLNNNMYGITVPDTSSYTADKTIATTEDIPTSASSSSTSTSTVTPTTETFVTGVTPTTDTWTFALSDGTSVQKTVVLGVTPTTGSAMTGASVATTTTTTTTLS